MSGPEASLDSLAELHGVHTSFFALDGTRHTAGRDTLRALLAALGVEADTDAMIREHLRAHQAAMAARIIDPEHILKAEQSGCVPVHQPCAWVLLTEDGAQVGEGRAETTATLPPLEVGYYRLVVTQAAQGSQGSRAATTQSARIFARPDHAPDVTDRTGQQRCWGFIGALYGLRSSENGGLGNYSDLADACAAMGQAGAHFFGINPVHALGWAGGDMISPYSPTHRGFFNIDHIATAAGLGPTPRSSLIDYATFRDRHRAALRTEFDAFAAAPGSSAFETWKAAQGEALVRFSQFEAISATHGPDARLWPAALQGPGPAAQDAAGNAAAFHAWLQWRAETQLDGAQASARAAGMSLGLYLDLAVGPRPGGAETWMNPDTIAKGVTIGAPPDHLSPEGQSWALAAHAPGSLATAFYAPLRDMLRKLMVRCGLLRIDHALGLLRSYWIPDDGSPGGYISQPLDTFLAIIAIEAERTGCVIVGEDLGLVPDGFRERLGAAGLYSYAVWQFETFHDGQIRPASDLSAHSMACFATHDTPTLRGFWYGEDIAWWHSVGWLSGNAVNARHAQRARQRQSLRAQCNLGPTASADGISQAVHVALAQAPSALLAVQLDDALGLTDAQNLPGTIDEHPNWRRRLPLAVEDFADCNDIQSACDLMPDDRRTLRT
ncbi:MAG: 4-alpha-glucanotransferase [Pseudomonadota bacterium]